MIRLKCNDDFNSQNISDNDDSNDSSNDNDNDVMIIIGKKQQQ